MIKQPLSNFLQMYEEKAEIFFIIKGFFFLGIEIQVKIFLFIFGLIYLMKFLHYLLNCMVSD